MFVITDSQSISISEVLFVFQIKSIWTTALDPMEMRRRINSIESREMLISRLKFDFPLKVLDGGKGETQFHLCFSPIAAGVFNNNIYKTEVSIIVSGRSISFSNHAHKPFPIPSWPCSFVSIYPRVRWLD